MQTSEQLIQAPFGSYRDKILAVRHQVFVVEQGVPPVLEFDEWDALSEHVLLLQRDKAIATGRIRPTGQIGRLAVLAQYRGQGHGTRVLAALEQLGQRRGLTEVFLHAQLTAKDFYLAQGYRPYGETFLDAAIEHIGMKKPL